MTPFRALVATLLSVTVLLAAVPLAAGSAVVAGPPPKPDIDVSPSFIEQAVNPEGPATAMLTIANKGTAALEWSLTQDPQEDWLSPDLSSGTVAPKGSQQVALSFHTAGLALGEYSTTLKVVSNDPNESLILVPVILQVAEWGALEADTSLATAVDTDKCAGGAPAILEVVKAVGPGQPVNIPIGGFVTTFTYPASLLQVLEARFKAPFDTGEVSVDNAAGMVKLAALATGGANAPTGPMAFFTLRMVGSVEEDTPVALTFNQIVDSAGKLIAEKSPLPQRTYRRGDAKADGNINMADVMFIGHYLAGIKQLGDGPTFVNALNAASTRPDDGCDKIGVADMLFLAQYLADLRGPDMKPKP